MNWNRPVNRFLGMVLAALIAGAMLLFPCLPVRGLSGESLSLSRFDYVLALLGTPEAIWQIWTEGTNAVGVSDRFWFLAKGFFVLIFSTLLGRQILAIEGRDQHLDRISLYCVSLLIGFVSITLVCMVCLIAAPSQELESTILWLVLILLLALSWIRMRTSILMRTSKRETQTSGEVRSDRPSIQSDEVDGSFHESWRRRLVGIFSIAILSLFLFQLIGSLVPTVDIEVRKKVWSPIVHRVDGTDDTALISRRIQDCLEIHFYAASLFGGQKLPSRRFSNEQYEALPWMDKDLGVPVYLKLLLPIKFIFAAITWVGFLLLYQDSKQRFGVLPSLLCWFLLATTPSLFELIRLGRYEGMIGSYLLAAIHLTTKGYEFERGIQFSRFLCILPVVYWVYGFMRETAQSDYLAVDSLARFVGFSALHSIPWIACCLVGFFVATSSLTRWMSFGGFVLYLWIALYLHRADRWWAPSIVLFAPAAVAGIAFMVQGMNRWVGLPVWLIVGSIGWLLSVAWPTCDNRWLVSLEYASVQDGGNRIHPEDLDSKIPWGSEMIRLFSDGTIPSDSQIVVLGTWDDLDIPFRCQRPEPNQSTEEHVLSIGATHLAFVDPKDKWDRSITEGREEEMRLWIRLAEKKGRLQRIRTQSAAEELELFAISYTADEDIEQN